MHLDCQRIAFALRVSAELVKGVIYDQQLFRVTEQVTEKELYDPALIEQQNEAAKNRKEKSRKAYKSHHGHYPEEVEQQQGDQPATAARPQGGRVATAAQYPAQYSTEENSTEENSIGKSDTHLSGDDLGEWKSTWLDFLAHRKELGLNNYASKRSENLKFQALMALADGKVSKGQQIVDQSRKYQWKSLQELKGSASSEARMAEVTYSQLSIAAKQKLKHPIRLKGPKGELMEAARPGAPAVPVKSG
jgi:hypothetical protein